jgi:hypothetical protein
MFFITDMATRTNESAPDLTYPDEVMCANWTPALQCALQPAVAARTRSTLPKDLSAVDVEEFLERMYACQQA